MKFCLDKRLEADSTLIMHLELCQVRLSNDARYPWCILIPELPEVYELHELDWDTQLVVLRASNILSDALQSLYKPHKINIACLGNIVKQLHIHHVARFEYDVTWPKPIWGTGEAKAYTESALNTEINKIKQALIERC